MSTLSTTPRGRTTWDIDTTHSSVGFSVRHLVISKVHGRFTRWSGSLLLDEQQPERSSVEVTIDAGSIETHEPRRDGHLRSADFLDTDRHPTIQFRSTRVDRAGEGRYEIGGSLTIAGVTRDVRVDAETLGRAKDPWGGERIGFSARTSIDRRDFGLTWNQALETGGVLVGDTVEIGIEVEAIRKVEEPASRAA